jgi:hypothetical protein
VVRAFLTYVQGANLTGSAAQVIEQFKKEVEESQAVTFEEWIDDLGDTIGGVLSAIGRTIDPDEQPSRYGIPDVLRLLWEGLAPLWDVLQSSARTASAGATATPPPPPPPPATSPRRIPAKRGSAKRGSAKRSTARSA